MQKVGDELAANFGHGSHSTARSLSPHKVSVTGIQSLNLKKYLICESLSKGKING
jgi:hypothetical protein